MKEHKIQLAISFGFYHDVISNNHSIVIFSGSGWIFISYLEHPSEKLAFYQKVGAPWFGKKAYYRYLNQVEAGRE
jgi:hypothetical protein